MLAGDIADKLAWATLQLQSPDFIDTDLSDRHGDLLFSVETRDGALRYLLVEHQSAHDPSMPLRVHISQGRIWLRLRKIDDGPLPLIIPLLVSHAPGGWTSPPTLDAMLAIPADVELAPFVPNLTLVVEDLARRSNEQLDAGLSSLLAKLTLWLLRDARNADQFRTNLAYWAPHFAAAIRTTGAEHSVQSLVNYVALVCERPMWDTFVATIRALAPEAQEMMMTIAEELIAQGRKEGREEGREEGRVRGRADLLSKQLTLKFGPLPAHVAQRLTDASIAELDLWAERVLFCASLDEVFAGSH